MALSGSFGKTVDHPRPEAGEAQGPSGRRRQLHILYLLNDLLHHVKYHTDSSSIYPILDGDAQSFLVHLFGFVSAYSIEAYAIHHKKIQNLLDLWDSNGYCQSSRMAKLRETKAKAAELGFPFSDDETSTANALGEESLSEEKKEAPYIMPASHGDSLTPFYDLPAANILPHIMPNSAIPINPQLVKPLQFTEGPANEGLTTAVKNFLRDIESLDKAVSDEDMFVDVDELGQHVKRDEITGDILEGDGYYGWSRAFCEKMKGRGAGFGSISNAGRRDSNYDRGSNPHQQRRDSISSGRSRSRSWSNSSRSRKFIRRRNGHVSVSRSRSRSRRPSRESRPYRSLRSRSRSRSRSLSYSPPPVVSTDPGPVPPSIDPRPLPRDRTQGIPPLQPPPFAHPLSQGFPPLGPGGLPIPPPPPPNYRGPWPPPPPPPLPPTTSGMYHDNSQQSFSPRSQDVAQGQLSQDSGSWGHLQNGSLFHGGRGRGRAQPSLSGRGFGQRGWGR